MNFQELMAATAGAALLSWMLMMIMFVPIYLGHVFFAKEISRFFEEHPVKL